MKVYEIKELGDITLIAFDGNKKEALKWYCEETMCYESGISSFTILPRKKWKDITIKYNEYKVKPFAMTIEELMQGHTWNEILASTAYL